MCECYSALQSKYSRLILSPPSLRDITNIPKVRSLVRGRARTESRSLNLGSVPFSGMLPSIERRAWQPTAIFLPGESHGQRILASYVGLWVAKSQTEVTLHTHNVFQWTFRDWEHSREQSRQSLLSEGADQQQ